jgi:hypothetical protein|tara:strand:+ start:83 stop:286 length:204 start_codon:yes stop_codon:yes gene_type:complete
MGVLIIEVAAIAISVTLNAAAFHLQNLKLYSNPFNQSYTIESITPVLLEENRELRIENKLLLKSSDA